MARPIPQLSTRRQLLRAGLTAAVGSWAALEILGASTANASPTSPIPRPVKRISMVGDSLTVGTMRYQADDLESAGWTHAAIDAYVSRGVRTKVHADAHTGLTAVEAIRAKSGDSEAWVIGLGTNDSVIYAKSKHTQVIQLMMDQIGSGHKVLWVNVHLDDKRKAQQQAWNTSLDEMAKSTDGMFVFDWSSLVANNSKWLAKDGLHCSPTGYKYRSIAVGLASRMMLPNEYERTTEVGPGRPAYRNLVE